MCLTIVAIIISSIDIWCQLIDAANGTSALAGLAPFGPESRAPVPTLQRCSAQLYPFLSAVFQWVLYSIMCCSSVSIGLQQLRFRLSTHSMPARASHGPWRWFCISRWSLFISFLSHIAEGGLPQRFVAWIVLSRTLWPWECSIWRLSSPWLVLPRWWPKTLM